jgi:hypothetical protein
MNKLEKLLNNITSPARKERIISMADFNIFGGVKNASGDQHGIFQHFQSDVINYSTREKSLEMRGGKSGPSRDDLYSVGPKHDESYQPTEVASNSLSTRYSPDRVGVQARRLGDGIYQDPYTKKIYDYNDGFRAEDGRDFSGGGVSLQSNIMRLGKEEIRAITKISSGLRSSGNHLLANKIEHKFGI